MRCCGTRTRHYAALRAAGAAVHLPAHDAWAIAGYEDVRRALMDWASFSSGAGVFLIEERNRETAGRSILNTDPPLHDQMRQVYQEHISLRPLRAKAALVQQRAEALVDQLVARGSFDAVPELAGRFSVETVCELSGLPPEGRDAMLAYSNSAFDIQGPLNARHQRALERVGELVDYVASLTSGDQLAPGSWGEAILQGADTGRYPHAWARATIHSFIVAGMDTTMNAIGNAVWLFSENPDEWDAVRAEPSLVPQAFAEAIRCESPIQWFSRQITAPTPVGETIVLPAGTRVILIYGAANRDPRVFPDPDRFDVRRGGKGHLAFGFGVHGCVGQALARLEGHAILTALAQRVARFTVTGAERHLNNTLRGFRSLQVTVRGGG